MAELAVRLLGCGMPLQRRDMELRLAAMDTQGDRAKAAERKAHIVHGSSTGLPGSRPASRVSWPFCRWTYGAAPGYCEHRATPPP